MAIQTDSKFDFSVSPYVHFENSFSEAKQLISKDPNAVYLATATVAGVPSVRTVLFKGIVREGFSFYTNYDSQKSQDLLSNPRASMLFYWPVMDHQIRIEGVVEKMTRQESEAYFNTRPRLSQIGAWASKQSRPAAGTEELASRVVEMEKKFAGQDIPCPPNWGGFLLRPLVMEFWYGKTARLHERYVYQREDAKSSWNTEMKFP